MFNQSKNLVSTAVAVAKAAAASGQVKASPETVELRMSMCSICPKFSSEDTIKAGINLGRKCTVCGCHMKFKAALEAAKCPEGKW